jgi:hypothetical protein
MAGMNEPQPASATPICEGICLGFLCSELLHKGISLKEEMQRFAEPLRQFHHGVDAHIVHRVLHLGDMSLSDPSVARELALAQPSFNPEPPKIAGKKLPFRLTVRDTLFCHHGQRAFSPRRRILFGMRHEQYSLPSPQGAFEAAPGASNRFGAI